MTERPHVFVAMRLADDARARIDSDCDVEYHGGRGMPSPEELVAGLRQAEGLLGSAQLPIGANTIAQAPRLRVISNFGVGFNNIDLNAATARGIVVCNTPGVLSNAVADLTIAMILSMTRRLFESERFVREGHWGTEPALDLGIDVEGKTLGIIGLGRIGVAVATRARAFGMNVCFHDRFEVPPEDATFCQYRDLNALLQEADFVTLHVNLEAETRHMIGAEQFALMRPTAYLINTSRGPTVNQDALVNALQTGTIAGAALDVLEREPPAPGEPILAAPNVVLLPHIGSATVETRLAMRDLAIDNLLLALRGERPKAVVNPEVLG